MRLITTLYLIILSINTYSQTCPPNIDFENGDFSNWQCFKGSTYTSSGQNVINVVPCPPTPGRHEIITAASTPTMDPYANILRHCPYGGNYSIKLGNDNTGSEAEGLSYTFQIPPSADTFSLTYFYAVVFQDPGHPASDQPRFFVTAYNVATGALINCASYNYISTASIPGFTVSTVDPSVLYKDWTPASIDFSGLAGQTVRLEFKTADCTQGGHFGYAYVDVSTGCGGLITVAALCGSSNSVVLNAPYGFQSYTWYNSNYSVAVGNQQNVTLSPAPPANSLFHVDMIPYPGFGCRDTSDAIVTALPVPDTPLAITNYAYCQLAVPQILTATATPPNQLLWYTTAIGGVGSTTAPLPSTTNTGSFHYYVTQKVLFGCESERREIVVDVVPTPATAFTINNDSQCQETNNFIFTNNTTNTNPNVVYTWDFGDGNTSAQVNTNHTYANYGTFDVKLISLNPPAACSSELVKQVHVIAKPIAQFLYTQTVCEQQTPIILTDQSGIPGNSGTINQWHWTIAGSNVTLQNPLPFLANGGPLQIQFVVGTMQGCYSDTNTFSLPVHYRPSAKFIYGPLLCNNEIIHFTEQSILPPAASPDHVVNWAWEFDNTISSTQQNHAILLTAGIHHVKLVSETDIGCKAVAADSSFTIYEKPHIGINISDSCVYRNIQYSAINTGSNLAVSWYWNFGNGLHHDAQNIIKTFITEGYNLFTLIGQSVQGCKDTLIRPYTIYQNHSFAGNDTIAAMNQPVELNAGGTDILSYLWSPSTGLNNTHIVNPIASLDMDQLYELNTISVYGCDAHSRIFIKRYKGPELFIPGAFTPNADGLNDVLKVFPVGIKVFHSFAVYNRFGVRLFYTTDFHKGWDGTYKGAQSDPGAYVFYARALDYKGNILEKKGAVILLR